MKVSKAVEFALGAGLGDGRDERERRWTWPQATGPRLSSSSDGGRHFAGGSSCGTKVILYDSSYGNIKKGSDDVTPQPFATGHPSVSDNRAKEEDLAAKSNYFGISADNETGMFSSTMLAD